VPPLYWEVQLNKVTPPPVGNYQYYYISGEEVLIGTGLSTSLALEARIRAQWVDGWGPWSAWLHTP
jgi:hypothetical protein